MSRIFLGIGAQKAGTSWLHRCLAVHPDVWLPPVKELHFFDERTKRPSERLPPRIVTARVRVELKEFAGHLVRERDWRALAWGSRYFLMRRDIEWYRRVLAHPGRSVVGEITPAYSTLPKDDVRRLVAELPDVHAVLILRNPVERAFSHAAMDLARTARGGIATVPTAAFYEHFRSSDSVKRTQYSVTIHRWERALGAEKLLVLFYEEISEHPVRVLERISEFLKIERINWSERAPVDARVNAGSTSRIPREYRAFLANMYRKEIETLAHRFHGYPEHWLARNDDGVRESNGSERMPSSSS